VRVRTPQRDQVTVVVIEEEDLLQLWTRGHLGECPVRLGLLISQKLHRHDRTVASANSHQVIFPRTPAAAASRVLPTMINLTGATPCKHARMAKMSVTWTLTGAGWADCTVADEHAEASATVSCITAAPEDLLTAVARLTLGEEELRVRLDAEPTIFRWIFHRENSDVWVQVLELADDRKPDKAGAEIWSSRQTTDTVARAFVRALDEVAHKYGESGYHGKWGSPFPRFELETLRTAWRDHKDESPGSPA
jgi:hypothetical protein